MNGKKNATKGRCLQNKLVIACAMMMLLNACTSVLSGSFREIYEPIYPDYERDTVKTIRQIDWNNIVYLKGCENGRIK